MILIPRAASLPRAPYRAPLLTRSHTVQSSHALRLLAIVYQNAKIDPSMPFALSCSLRDIHDGKLDKRAASIFDSKFHKSTTGPERIFLFPDHSAAVGRVDDAGIITFAPAVFIWPETVSQIPLPGQRDAGTFDLSMERGNLMLKWRSMFSNAASEVNEISSPEVLRALEHSASAWCDAYEDLDTDIETAWPAIFFMPKPIAEETRQAVARWAERLSRAAALRFSDIWSLTVTVTETRIFQDGRPPAPEVVIRTQSSADAEIAFDIKAEALVQKALMDTAAGATLLNRVDVCRQSQSRDLVTRYAGTLVDAECLQSDVDTISSHEKLSGQRDFSALLNDWEALRRAV